MPEASRDGVAALCGELHRFARELGAPDRVLEQLAAAARGQPLPHDSILPLSPDDCTEVASARLVLAQVLDVVQPYLARRIGAVRSEKKAAAARENGRKGGRPRKVH